MSTPHHTPIPPEIEEAILQKPAAEQERLRLVWELLGHLDFEDLHSMDKERVDFNEEEMDLDGLEVTNFDAEGLNIPDTEAALAALEKAIEATPAQPGAPAGDRAAKQNVRFLRPRQVQSKPMQWITATATLFIVLFAVMIWFWRVPMVVKAPLGEQVTVRLPDNSSVTLNSGSRLEYARRFESWPLIATTRRRVHLQGEAYFEVEKMARPFVVESFNAQVRVLGTTFNVWARAYDDLPETRVTLSSGSVVVTSHDEANEMATLNKAGDMVRIISDKNGATVSLPDTVPVEYAAAWRSNGFSAFELPLASIVSEIERQYKVVIALDDAIDAAHTLTFFHKEKPTIEDLIESICLSMTCQYRQTSNGFSIFQPSSN